MNVALEFDNVNVLFSNADGAQAHRRAAVGPGDARWGSDRTAIESKTGVVVGVSNANLTVIRGQISVLMGPVRVREVDAAAGRQWAQPRDARSGAGQRRPDADRRR
jgi:hypothetical protein